jgi:TonB family protein
LKFYDASVQKSLLQSLLLFLTVTLSSAQDVSPQANASRMVFSSLSGPIRNAVVYAPNPVYPPAALQQRLSGRGVYKMDLDSGTPYDVRVVQSAGYKILDDAAVETLRTWRFLPHRLTWVTIPIEFRAAMSPGIGKYPVGAKAIVIYAPKPDYPLEARARHLTGRGIVMLDVDVPTGRAIKAYMLQSMGHQILDEAALSAFRRWRFQPGKAAPQVKIPIAYTMTGTTY